MDSDGDTQRTKRRRLHSPEPDPHTPYSLDPTSTLDDLQGEHVLSVASAAGCRSTTASSPHLTTIDPHPDERLGGNGMPRPPRPPGLVVTGGNVFDNRGTLINNFYPPPTTDHTADALLKHSAPNAIHSSAAVASQDVCTPGTRAFTLQRLQSLLGSVNDTDPDLVWMHGPAGAGKSAIMRTMANALEKQGVLLGSFFFFRADGQRNTSAPFVPTIALQALTSLPASHRHIQQAVQTQHTLFTQSVQRQLRFLLEIPLELSADGEPTWNAGTPFVIVIDGLDECSDADRQVEIIRAMLQLVTTIRSSTARRMKVLVASRPEPRIKDEFEGNQDPVTIIKLEPDDANIDLYCDVRLEEIRRRNHLPDSWPASEEIGWLRWMSSDQYAFPSISMRFLGGGDPVERLKMLQTGIGTHGLEPFEALDALYSFIFHQVPPEMLQAALFVVRFVLDVRTLRRHEHSALERILSLLSGLISRLSPYLSSILDVDKYYRPYHASLHDFLREPSRSQKFSLYINTTMLSTTFVEGMLRVCITVSEDRNLLIQDFDVLSAWLSDAWLESYLSHFQLSPRIVDSLDILPSLLLRMDGLSFGYYSFLFSKLSDTPFTKEPACMDTVRIIRSEIRTLQQVHFAPYEALEAGGDSGFGLFGILLVGASGFADYCSNLQVKQSVDISPFGLQQTIPHLIYENRHLLSPGSTIPPSLVLHHLAEKPCPKYERWESCRAKLYPPAFVLAPLQQRQSPSGCLSSAVELLLSLPSGKTRIQRQILEFISCLDHTTLDRRCNTCMRNLTDIQTSGIGAVYGFWTRSRNISASVHYWCFNVDIFNRACDFISNEHIHWYDRFQISSLMLFVGDVMVDESNTAVDKCNTSEIRLIDVVARLHKVKEQAQSELDRDHVHTTI